MKEMTGKGAFIRGAVILSLSGIFVKLLGAVLRIPLANKLGAGMAYYNVAYTVYTVFLVLATAGFPVAVSRLVSERIARGNRAGANKVFFTALKLLAVFGSCAFGVCFFGAEFIACAIDIPEAALSLRAIAPALCIVPLLAAFRGYFQGQQNMKPTAVSEVFEQVVRVGTGLALGFGLYAAGLPAAAAGASFGAAAGAMAGILAVLVMYRKYSSGGKNAGLRGAATSVTAATARTGMTTTAAKGMMSTTGMSTMAATTTTVTAEKTGDILKKILAIAVPVIIGAEIMPLMSAIDMSLVASRLQDSGWTKEEALNLYSQYGAYCDTLIALPQTFTQAIAVSLVPAITAFFGQRRRGAVQDTIKVSMRMTMLLACPCAAGLFVLAKPIMLLLYFNQAENALQAAPTLQVMTIGVIFLAICQTTTGALQSVGKQQIPVRNLALGALAKIGVTYVLLGIPAVNVKGAAIGTNAAYLIALLLNMHSLKKETGVSFNAVQTYLKPAAASLIMAVCVFASYRILSIWMTNGPAALGSIALGVVSYSILAVRMGAVSREEFSALPGGSLLLKILQI